MAQLFTNNAYGSLASAASNSTTTLTLATGNGARFPSPSGGDYFLATLIGLDSNGSETSWEVVKVTARATDTLTVVRGQESTTAVAWAAGSRIELRVTARTMGSLLPFSGGTLTGPISSETYLDFRTKGVPQFLVMNTDNAVNQIRVTGSSTGQHSKIQTYGTDASIGLTIQSKGAGSFLFQDDLGARGLLVSPVASAVNYLQTVSAVTGAAPYMTAAGTDANVSLVLASKGTGNVLLSANSATALAVWNPASAVNAVIINGNTTGNGPSISSTGSDANITLNLSAKGSYPVAVNSPLLAGKAINETRVAIPASAIDLAAGNYFTKTISTASTLTVSNVPAAGTSASFILDLTNGGSAVITWWTGVKWSGGTAPTLTAAGRDVLGFFTHDGGTTWTGLLLGKDVK